MPGFKPKGKQIEKLPEELAKSIKSSETEAVTPVSKMGTMFASAEPVFAPFKAKRAKVKGQIKKGEEAKEVEEEEPLEKPLAKAVSDEILGDIESDDLNLMKVLIENEKKGIDSDGDDKFS